MVRKGWKFDDDHILSEVKHENEVISEVTKLKTGLVTPIYLEDVDGKVVNKDLLCLALDFGHEDVIKYLFREFHTSSFYTFTDQYSQQVPKGQNPLKHHTESHEAISKFYPHYQFALEYFLHELEVQNQSAFLIFTPFFRPSKGSNARCDTTTTSCESVTSSSRT